MATKRQANSEEATLIDNKILSNASQKEEVKKMTKEEEMEYYKLSKFEYFLVILGSGLWSFWLIKFGFTTLEKNKTTPILGVERNSFGFYQDKSDIQWNSFIGNIDILLFSTIVFLILSSIIKKVFAESKSKIALMLFNIMFGSAMYIFMFRGGFLFWIFFSIVNFLIIQLFSGKTIFPLLIWSLNIGLLFINDKYHGFNLVDFFHTDLLKPLEDTRKDEVVSWHIMYNMTLLRIISFGIDKHWAKLKFRSLQKEKHQSACKTCQQGLVCLRERYEQYHEVEEYSIIPYLTYLLYLPILITGPPITFNAFFSQIKNPQMTHQLKDKIKYTFRTIFVFATFMVWVHINFGFALATRSENEHIWRDMEPFDLFMCGFNCLMFIWMKFNCLWKYSRCWALWDDVEVPENMNRCVNNNYNFEGFWRSWHRGFNQWLIRYIYLPCGGSKTKAWNIWVVFTFVAIWHDLNLNLLLWAWGICLCLIPEIAVKSLVQKPRFYKYTKNHYWKYVCGVCGAIYIIFLIFTNLIGFGTGYQTLILFLQRSFSSVQGILEFCLGLSFMSVVTLYMMVLRINENTNY